MARREVIEIQCDRCEKVETQNKSEVSPEETAELTLTFEGETTTYQDLCRRCRGTVANYVTRLRREKEDADDPKNGKMPVGKKKSSLPEPDFQAPPSKSVTAK